MTGDTGFVDIEVGRNRLCCLKNLGYLLHITKLRKTFNQRKCAAMLLIAFRVPVIKVQMKPGIGIFLCLRELSILPYVVDTLV